VLGGASQGAGGALLASRIGNQAGGGLAICWETKGFDNCSGMC
jgi:hypothetical protein